MARLARVVAEGVPHYVTQRGNARQFLLNTDADRMLYLDLDGWPALRRSAKIRVPHPFQRAARFLQRRWKGWDKIALSCLRDFVVSGVVVIGIS
jgi:hypothetical protein